MNFKVNGRPRIVFNKTSEKVRTNDIVFYNAVHNWMHSKLSQAKYCCFCNRNDNRRYEWALLKGLSYEFNIYNFIPLCKSCHTKYDMTNEIRKKISNSMKGKPPGYFKKIECIKPDGSYSNFNSISSASRELGILITSINNCLTGRTKTSGGYKWRYTQ